MGTDELRAANATAPREATESCTLLVVDDSGPNRDALSRLLVRDGYRVLTAANGHEALERLGQSPIDLVLLDVLMPGLDGLEVLRALRQTHAPTALPVIMATGRDGSDDIVRALELGANDYITKPLDMPVVLARVQTQLALKRSVQKILDLEERLRHRNAELAAANERLQRTHDHMRRDLLAAARIQEAFLPRAPVGVPGLEFAWFFQPCAELAGDALNVCPLDEEHVGVYVLDVSGHGVAAALLAVAVTRALSPAAGPASLLLRPDGGPGDRLASPAEVAARLNQRFPFDGATEQFFTIVYGIVDTRQREFRYVSAGHPSVIHLPRDRAAVAHALTGLPIGLEAVYEEHAISLQQGDRLYLYSDGLTEAPGPGGEVFGGERLLQTLDRGRHLPLGASLDLLRDELRRWHGGTAQRDDVSVLAVEAV
jgi:sigma-B regulation protein RsbU (phosphoserine phosphatase)